MTGTDILNEARHNRVLALEYIANARRSDRNNRCGKAIFQSRFRRHLQHEGMLFGTYEALQQAA